MGLEEDHKFAIDALASKMYATNALAKDNLTDAAIYWETHICHILNMVSPKTKLENTNLSEPNSPTRDLHDLSARVAWQITITKTRSKIVEALKSFEKKGLFKKYDEINFMVIGTRKQFKEFKEEFSFQFSARNNIHFLLDLPSKARHNPEVMHQLAEYCRQNLSQTGNSDIEGEKTSNKYGDQVLLIRRRIESLRKDYMQSEHDLPEWISGDRARQEERNQKKEDLCHQIFMSLETDIMPGLKDLMREVGIRGINEDQVDRIYSFHFFNHWVFKGVSSILDALDQSIKDGYPPVLVMTESTRKLLDKITILRRRLEAIKNSYRQSKYKLPMWVTGDKEKQRESDQARRNLDHQVSMDLEFGVKSELRELMREIGTQGIAEDLVYRIQNLSSSHGGDWVFRDVETILDGLEQRLKNGYTPI